MGGDDAQNKQTECRGVINAFSDTLPVLDLATWRHVDGHHALRERVRPENGRAKRRGPHPLAGAVRDMYVFIARRRRAAQRPAGLASRESRENARAARRSCT